jgi:hypothetical protein
MTEALSIDQSYANWLFSAVGVAIVLGLVWTLTATIPVTVTGTGVVLDEDGRAVVYMTESDIKVLRPGQIIQLTPLESVGRRRESVPGRIVETGREPASTGLVFGVPVIVAIDGQALRRIPARTRVIGETAIGTRRPFTLILPESWR